METRNSSGDEIPKRDDMLPPSHLSSHIMFLRPRGHDYDMFLIESLNYEATKRSFMMRCLYGQRQYVVDLLFSPR